MSPTSRQVQEEARRSAPTRRRSPPGGREGARGTVSGARGTVPGPRGPGPTRAPRRARLLERRDAWIALPLRAFLGITFIYAGLQKFADRWFFSASAPSSIQAQLHHAAATSPVGGLLGGLAHHAVLVGLTIAFAELAVGLGTLLGLWTRATAAAGMVLSVGFLLAVSWHARPFYYGADIVFLFAWTPLLIGGAGPLSVDAVARAGIRDRLGLPSDPTVIIGFDAVRQLCGAYNEGRCRLRRDHRCAPDGCPVLAASSPPSAVTGEVERRAFMQKAGIAGWLAAAAVVGGGIVALIGRVAPTKASKAAPVAGPQPPAPSLPAASVPSTSDASAPTSSALAPSEAAAPPAAASASAGAAAPTTPPPPPPPGLTALGPATAVAVGGAASFTDPSTGDAAFVVQPTAGRFVAFTATCTHQGCPVQYAGSHFECPCHGAQFDSATGEVLQGPASSPLRKIGITLSGGTLYAK